MKNVGLISLKQLIILDSKDHIHKLKNDSFILGKHYHKKSGKLLFDKVELDKWVTIDNKSLDAKEIANKVLNGLI